MSNTTAVDYAALIAATNTVEVTKNNNNNTVNKNEKHILAVENNNPESGLGNSPKSINLSRQNSTRCVCNYTVDLSDREKNALAYANYLILLHYKT